MPDQLGTSPTDAQSAPGDHRTSVFGRMARAWDGILRNPSAMIMVSLVAQNILRMGSNIILARLLAPSAFALIAITTLVLSGIQMVSDVGIAITALREGQMSRQDEEKLWTMQSIRGLGVGLLMIASAVPVGWIYQNDQIRNVLFALALMPIIQGVQSLYPVLALGHRRLLPTTLLEVGSRVISTAVTILAAMSNPTVWSLVIGTLTGAAVSTIGSHLLAGYRPRIMFDRGYIQSQWKFSRWIQMSSTLFFLSGQVDKVIFPFLFGMSALGVYGIGATLAAMPAQITQRWSGSVFYPLAVQLLLGDPAARAQLIRVRTTMLLYSAVFTLAIVAVSPAFFMLLYEPQYHAAARFAQILAIGAFFEIAESSLRHLPLVDGTPHYEVWVVVVKLAAFAAAVPVTLALGGGVAGYALATVFGMIASHVFMLIVCVRRGYLSVRTDLVLTPALMGAAALIYLVPRNEASTLTLVAEGGAIGVAALVALLLVYSRRGLPSLPAEPAPDVLREAAEEELGERSLA